MAKGRTYFSGLGRSHEATIYLAAKSKTGEPVNKSAPRESIQRGLKFITEAIQNAQIDSSVFAGVPKKMSEL